MYEEYFSLKERPFLTAAFASMRWTPRTSNAKSSTSCAAASKATSDGVKSVRRTNASASCAPYSRFIPESSHSIDSGPWYPIRFSARKSSSKSTSPWPGETKSQPR